MSDGHFWLTVEQFARLEPYLPHDTRGKPRVDDRRVISGIVHVLKSGGRSAGLRSPQDAVQPLRLLGRQGRLGKLFHALAAAGAPPAQVMIDSTAVRAHRSAAGGKGGNTIRTARLQTSGAYLRDATFVMMTPSSQETGYPGNPERFRTKKTGNIV